MEQAGCNLRCLFSVLGSALECANQDVNVGRSLLELSPQSSVARHGLGHCESEAYMGCILVFSSFQDAI